jgi:hypothetical protein
MRSPVIDPEFRDLIPPLTEDERRELEASIQKYGCRDALSVWNGTLVDGHNRYEICNRLSIPFATAEVNLVDRDDAKAWIIGNQLSRRNLPDYQKARLVLLRDGIYKAQAKERQREAGGDHCSEDYKKALLQHGGEALSKGNRHEWTDKRLGREAGVSHGTIQRVRVIEREASPEVKAALVAGKTTINREYQKIKKPASKLTMQKTERVEKIRELSAQGMNSEQIAERVDVQPAHVRLLARESGIALPEVAIGNRRSIDANRLVSETVMQCEGIVFGLELIDSRLNDINTDNINSWIASLSSTVSALNSLIKKLRRQNNNGK